MSTVLENEAQVAGPNEPIDWKELEKLLDDGSNNNDRYGGGGDDDSDHLPKEPEFEPSRIKFALALGASALLDTVLAVGGMEGNYYMITGGVIFGAAAGSTRTVKFYSKKALTDFFNIVNT